MLPIIEPMKGESEIFAFQIAEYLLTRKIRDYNQLTVNSQKKINSSRSHFKFLLNEIKINKNINSLVFSRIKIGAEFSITEKLRDCLIVNKSITNLYISYCD